MSGNVFALGRFGIAVLLIIGGIAAIYWGYQLFLHGSGLSKGVDKLDFKSDWGESFVRGDERWRRAHGYVRILGWVCLSIRA
jgi:hypothetical protein